MKDCQTGLDRKAHLQEIVLSLCVSLSIFHNFLTIVADSMLNTGHVKSNRSSHLRENKFDLDEEVKQQEEVLLVESKTTVQRTKDTPRALGRPPAVMSSASSNVCQHYSL